MYEIRQVMQILLSLRFILKIVRTAIRQNNRACHGLMVILKYLRSTFDKSGESLYRYYRFKAKSNLFL